jgi:citrate synthase
MKQDNTRTAQLTLEGNVYTLPIVKGTMGEKAIDISTLLKETGYITLDTGYKNTGSCTSTITYHDGKQWILRYRGYDIEALANNCSFVEVCYLLLHGELPHEEQLRSFKSLMERFALSHEDMIHFFDHFPSHASPMSILSVMVNSLCNYYPEMSNDPMEDFDITSTRIISKIRTIAAGINALWGPLHGGANEAVLDMLETIYADDSNFQKYINKAKDRNDPFRLSGFGHRVYKTYDPRGKIIKKACDEIMNVLDVSDPLLDIAYSLEEIALKDEYFIERNLFPNVDFYSGIIYRALGIPTNMFTVMFALGRVPGWIAQGKEKREDPATRIGRPRQIFIGETAREFVPLHNR